MLIALFYFFSQSLSLNIGYKNNYKKHIIIIKKNILLGVLELYFL